MMKQIFVDDILHAFESEGNLHLVLGIVMEMLMKRVMTYVMPS